MNPAEAAVCLTFGIALRLRFPKLLVEDAKAIEQSVLRRACRIYWGRL